VLAGAGALVLLALSCRFFVYAWQARGWFSWLGFDYGYFWAVTTALLAHGPAAVYDVDVLAAASQPLAAYYGAGGGRPLVVPPPWPPIFFLLLVPFAVLPLPLGYLLWTLANLGLALVVLHRLAARFPVPSWTVVATALAFFPLVDTLFQGQPTVLMLFALYRAYRAFEDHRDFRAGLWSGVLLAKPHYTLFLTLVLLYKGRWQALRGMAVVGLALFLSSFALLGPSGLLAYLGSLRSLSSFRLNEPLLAPEMMISWRGLLLNVLPASLPDALGLAVSAALSAATASALPIIWRGRWDPRAARFPIQMLATLLVTMLASFHNHIHGATLLLVPGMVLAAQGSGPRLVQATLRVGLYAPAVVFYLTGDAVLVAVLLILLMLIALIAAVAEAAGRERYPPAALPAGPASPAGRSPCPTLPAAPVP
jgi:hypothetical protein